MKTTYTILLSLLFSLVANNSIKAQCYTAPFTESFDITTQPACILTSATTGGPWDFNLGFTWNTSGCTGTPTDHTGNSGSFASMDQSGGDAGVILELDTIDVSSLTTPYLDFYYQMCGASYTPVNLLAIETFDGTSWVGVDTLQQGTNGWENFTYVLNSNTFGTNLLKVRFRAESGGSTLDYYGDQALDDIRVIEAPTCLVQTNLSTSNITPNSADLSWTDVNSAGNWEIQYGPIGFTLGTGTGVLSTTNPVTVSGLTADTEYDWYVRAICAVGDTSFWSQPSSFRTTCLAVSAPFIENFDGVSTPNLPACWSAIAPSTTTIQTVTTTDHGTPIPSGPNALEMNDAVPDVLVSPPLTDLNSGLNRVRVLIAFEGFQTTFTDTLFAGVTSSTTNAAAFIPLDTIILEQTDGSFTEVLINFDNPTAVGTNDRFAFSYASAGGGYEFFFDDLHYEAIPSCVVPNSPTATNLTNTTADLDWNEVNAATQWEIEYGLSGFSFGNGTRQVVNAKPYTLTGLTTYSSYEYYVRSICGSGDTSRWTQVPFEFIVGGPLSGTYTIDSTLAPSATNFLSFEAFSNAINNFGVGAPVVVNVAPDTYNDQLSLGAINGSSVTNTVLIDGGSALSTELTHDGSLRNSTVTMQGTSWLTIKNMTISSTKTGTDTWGIHMYDSTNNVTIDSSLIVMPIATTDDVVGIMASGSEASDITDGDNAFDITVSNNRITGANYGISFHGDDDTGPRSTGLTLRNNVVLFAEDYGINVRGYDGILIEENLVDSLNNTGSDALYLADNENFDLLGNILIGQDNGFDADDLNFANPVTTKSTIINNFFIGGDDGLFIDDSEEINFFHNSAYGDDYGIYLNDIAGFGVRNNIFYGETSDAFYLLDSVAIDLDYNDYYSNSANVARFGPTTARYADLAAWQADIPSLNVNSIEEDPLYVANTSDLHAQSVAMNDLGDNSLGITTDIDGDTRPLAPSTVVDMGADEYDPPACLTTSNETSFNITGVTADLSWTENGSATQWEVEYGLSGFTQGSTAGNLIIANNDTISLSGLSPLTAYDWYVRAVCGAGDTSAWSPVQVFGTGCPLTAFTATYIETFDSPGIVAADFNLANVGCWQAIGPGANDLEITTSTDHAGTTIPSAPNIVEFNDGDWSGGDTSMLVSPAFSDLSTGLNQLRMQVAFESATPADVSLYVGVISSPGNTATFTPLDTIDATDVGNSTNFGQVIIDLSNTTLIGSAQYIAIAHGPGAFEAYLDSFIYEPAPVVVPPVPYYPVGIINTVDANGVADSLNVRVRTSGTVVGVDLDGNSGLSFTIVDQSSNQQEGINIFNFNDVSNYVVNEGDSIMVIGDVDQFNGLQEVFVDSILVISTNASIPTPLAVNDVTENTESKWLELIDDFVLLDPSGTGTASYNMDASNGTDTITIRIDSDTDIHDTLMNTNNSLVAGDTVCMMRGIGGQFDGSNPFTSGYQILPQRWSDVMFCRFVSGVAENENQLGKLNIYPNPTNGLLTIQVSKLSSNDARLMVRDLSGKIILEDRLNSNAGYSQNFDFSDRANGIYFITIIDGDNLIHEKLIKN